MALDWTYVVTALNNFASHFDDTNKSILQFCEGTGKKVNETSSSLQVVRKEVHTLKQRAEKNDTSLNDYRAHGEGLDNRIGHLEAKISELEQDKSSLSQQVEFLKAKQTLDETSIQEVKEKVDEKLEALIREKLKEKLDQWVTLAFCPERSLAPAAGVSEDQQAFDSLGNQPGVEQYQRSQVSGT